MTGPIESLLWLEDDDSLARAWRRELSFRIPEVPLRRTRTVAETIDLLSGPAPLLAGVFDVLVPDGDGLDALEKGRALRPDLPAAVLTGVHLPEVEARAFSLGALLLHKPVSTDLVVSWLRRLAVPGEEARLAPLRRVVAHLAREVGLSAFEAEQLVCSADGPERREAVAARMSRPDRPVKVDGIKDARKRIVARVFAKYDLTTHEEVVQLVRRRLSERSR